MENWYLLLFLLCPLMHLLMMRGHNHGNNNCCGKKSASDLPKSKAEVKAP